MLFAHLKNFYNCVMLVGITRIASAELLLHLLYIFCVQIILEKKEIAEVKKDTAEVKKDVETIKSEFLI